MKELRFECDVHLAEQDKHVPAEHVGVEVQVADVKGLFVDLCAPHYSALIQPVVDAMTKYGYRDDPPKPKKGEKGPFQCAECDAKPYKTRRSLNGHVLEKHGLSMVEYKEKHGELVPVGAAA